MVTWNNDDSVQFEGIAEQHKILISIIQEVDNKINEETYHFKNLIDVVNNLDTYIKEHLAYEEAMMERYAYPAMHTPVSEHNELKYKIFSINYDNIGESKEIFIETYTYLLNWLINHIMKRSMTLNHVINLFFDALHTTAVCFGAEDIFI